MAGIQAEVWQWGISVKKWRAIWRHFRSLVYMWCQINSVQTSSGAAQWVPGALSQGIKWPEHESNHSPPSSADVKKTYVYTSTAP
jgi:hypothetical protein